MAEDSHNSLSNDCLTVVVHPALVQGIMTRHSRKIIFLMTGGSM